MKAQLAALTLAVKDLPLLKKFYTEIFGWDIVMENEKIAMLNLNGLTLSLCDESLFAEYTGIESARYNRKHYCTINLRSILEVDQHFANLKARGARISKKPQLTFWGGYSGFVADLEGNLWELCYNPVISD